jgi:hypothetical protein
MNSVTFTEIIISVVALYGCEMKSVTMRITRAENVGNGEVRNEEISIATVRIYRPVLYD